MGVTVDQMRIVMDAETARFEANIARAGRVHQSFEDATKARLQRLDGYFRTIGAGAAALGVGIGAKELEAYADSWHKVGRNMAAVGPVFGDDSVGKLTNLLNQGRLSIDDYASTVVNMAASVRGYGFSADDAQKSTLALAQALRIGGVEGSAHQSAMDAFAKALASGKLEGEELSKSLRFARAAQSALAAESGVSRESVLAMLRDGKISAEEFVRAMSKASASIGREFASKVPSVAESFARLKNSVIEYVGKLDEAIGASAGLSNRFEWMAANMDKIGGAVVVLAAGLLAAFAPAIVGGIVAAGAALTTMGGAATVAMGPFGLIAGLAGASAAAIALFGDRVTTSADGMVTLRDTSMAVIDILSSRMGPVVDWVGQRWAEATDIMRAAMQGVPVSMMDIVDAAQKAVNATIGLFQFAAADIGRAFRTIPPAVAEVFINMVNGVIANIEWMVRQTIELLNKIPGVDITPKIDMGRFTNPLTGSVDKLAGEISAAGFDLGKDFVGEWWKGSQSLRDEIAKRAREIADARRAAASAKGPDATFDRPTPKADDTADQMRRAAEQVEAIYRKALEATGRYSTLVQAEYDKELRKFQDLLDRKLISQEQFDRVRGNLAIVAAKQMNDAAEREFKRLREVTDAVAGNMERAFTSFMETGKFSFRDFTASVIKDIAKIAFKLMVLKPLMGGQGDSGFGLLGSVLGIGGPVAGTPLAGFAAGGSPPVGVPSVVGERGPELFVPRVPGTIIPNHELGGAGAANGQVYVTIMPSPEFHASVQSTAEGVVARSAPAIVGASVDATRRNLPGMIQNAQRRSM